MKNWFRSFRGTVPVRLRGAKPESVLSRCAREGIPCMDVHPAEDCVLRLKVYRSDAERLEKAALRCGCAAEFGRVRGVPHLRRVLARRRLALLLLTLAAVLTLWSSAYLWEIRVTGNETVSTGRILRALEESGVGVGKCWLGMQSEALQSELLLRIPELAWVSFQIRGSRADVIVTEAIPAPEVIDPDQPVSLVADAAGVIVKMTALNGQPMVRRGDAVAAGQLLISGAPEDLQGEKRSAHALGSVRARTFQTLTAAAPLETQKKTTTAVHTRWALILGKTRMNLCRSASPETPCDVTYAEYPLAIPGVFRLPVTLLRETRTEYTVSPMEETDPAALEQALTETLARRIGPEGEIVDSHLTEAEQNGLRILTLRSECEQEIAAPRADGD